ncbi:ABC transporter substrate-binding protein [Rhodoligotrophos ferricapiens]|uniref:ABC transporter substrate-binding protein n=1 Tax=Rhodoligotrophos ferricapiens TaxID=3069264 RepID=UPI00315D8219
MRDNLTRRHFLAGTAAAGLAASASFIPHSAAAKEDLVFVQWGGNYIKVSEAIVAKQDKANVTWELHSGGAAAILGKIKAAWPNVKYDAVAAWDPVFLSMMQEGWLEPISLEDVPNLKNVPESLIFKDDKGQFMTIPTSINANLWAYREDICPIKLTKIEDLLDPQLKGQIVFPDPLLSTNFAVVTLALARGGDEKNLEPGWEFLKELAKSGNIGRVAHSDNDIITSMTTGETSIDFGSAVVNGAIGKNFPVKTLGRVEGDKGFKTVIFTTGFVVLKGRNKKGACELINFMLSPENNALYNEAIGTLPSNTLAEVPERLSFLRFTEEEDKKFVYHADWAYVSGQLNNWMKRWETEIVPLLR